MTCSSADCSLHEAQGRVQSPERTPCRRWYRDPTLPVPRTEVTRFPHGVLEVKLSLPEGQKAPEWVSDLLDSGYLTEVRGIAFSRLGGHASSCWPAAAGHSQQLTFAAANTPSTAVAGPASAGPDVSDNQCIVKYEALLGLQCDLKDMPYLPWQCRLAWTRY